MSKQAEYFIVSVAHTTSSSPYITLWGPTNQGYRGQIETSGRYSWEEVMGHLSYYNNGCDTIAVPCVIVEGMMVETPTGFFDKIGDGPTHWLVNDRNNWKRLLDLTIALPAHDTPIKYKYKRESQKKPVAAPQVRVTPEQMREICSQAARYPQRYIYIADEVNKLLGSNRND